MKTSGKSILALLCAAHVALGVAGERTHGDAQRVVRCGCSVLGEPNGGTVRIGPFSSIEEAVFAASRRFNPSSIQEDREYLGVVLRGVAGGKDQYFYTVGAGRRGHGQVTVRIELPQSLRLAAFWHTHGAAGINRELFSRADVELVEQWQVPFYLADHTRQLKVFRPGTPVRFFSNWRLRQRYYGGWQGQAVAVPAKGTAASVAKRDRNTGSVC